MDKLMQSLSGLFGIVVVIMVLAFGVMVIYKMLFKSDTKKDKEEQTEDNQEESKGEKITYPYTLNQPILSPKERYFYRDVRPIADKLGLIVFTEIRLVDLLIVPKGTKDYTKWFNHIKAKHVDFVFVDREYQIKLLVEVDDPTHNRPDRQARDEAVDEMFRQVGMEVLHLRAWGKKYGTEDLETIITNALNVHLSSCGK